MRLPIRWGGLRAKIIAWFLVPTTIILSLVAKGLTNRAISRQLQISVSTVKYHLGNLCEKLDAGGRHELIALAVRRELA